MNARRYPRTLQQAFGAHTDNVLHPMPERRLARNGRGGVLLAIALGAVLGVLCWFWFTNGG